MLKCMNPSCSHSFLNIIQQSKFNLQLMKGKCVSVFSCPAAKTKKKTNNNSHNVTHSLKELRREKKRAYILVSIAIVSAVTWLPRN